MRSYIPPPFRGGREQGNRVSNMFDFGARTRYPSMPGDDREKRDWEGVFLGIDAEEDPPDWHHGLGVPMSQAREAAEREMSQ